MRLSSKLLRAAALLPVFVLLFSSCALFYLFETDFSDTELIYENQGLYYYDRLNENGRLAYTLILNAAGDQPEEIEVPALRSEEFDAVFCAVSYDHPEVLCFDKTSELRQVGKKYFYRPTYALTSAECAKRTAELNAAADGIVLTLPASLSDYEKELFVHDYLCSVCRYTPEEEGGRLKATAYDALILGKAVCEGYARAAQLLLQRLGIKTYLITGRGVNKDGQVENHMWNIVTLNGENYHVDVTWDDIDDEAAEALHTYFNLTDSAVGVNHSDFSPAQNNCVSTEMNYFVRNGVCFERHGKANAAAVEALSRGNVLSGRNYVELAYAGGDAYRAAQKAYIDRGGAYDILRTVNRRCKKNFKSVRYTQDEAMHTLQFYFYE